VPTPCVLRGIRANRSDFGVALRRRAGERRPDRHGVRTREAQPNDAGVTVGVRA
jgi:hypothetical protein